MFIHLLTVPLLGIALLWSLKQVYGRHLVARDDTLVLVMTIAAWVLIYLGIGLVFGPLLFFVALVIGGMTVARYRYTERCTLLWVLAIAADKGLPLSEAARSYATGRIDEMGRRASALADYLEQGIALPAALDLSKNPLPTEGDLAARLGYATDTLPTTLKEAAQESNQVVTTANAAYGSLLYFLIALNSMIFVISFVCIRIIPTYETILLDFDVEMPALTRVFITLANVFARYAWLLAPIALLAIILLVYALVAYLGFRVPDLPIIGRILGRHEVAIILRSIASGLGRGRPIDQTIDLLAHWYPVNYVGARLAAVADRVRDGADWCDSLVKVRLLSKNDAAVLKSAQRVGNLEWACRELADANARRASYRANTMSRFTGPLFAMILGVPTALFAIAMIMPLVSLIEALAG